MKIADILASKSSAIATVAHDQSFGTALRLMHSARIGSVVVVHAQSGALMGLVSQPEIVEALTILGSACLTHCVTGVMQRPAATCGPQDEVRAVMRRMSAERNRHIIVLSDHMLLGIVSIGDLVAAQLQQATLETAVLRDMAQSRLLAANS